MDILLVGIGGYGEYYMKMLTGWVLGEKNKLVGAVDPYARKSSWYPWFSENNIPIYNSIEEFYQKGQAELAILVTPINLHRQQAEYCFAHGSNVLCEKPVAASIQDALAMKAAAEKYNKKLGIGFQWSFCDGMNKLKNDILSGLYGKPLFFKTYISWQRNSDYYYQSSWKGRRADAKGNMINDCIITNATAHYLHNMFFLTDSKTTEYKAVCRKGYDIDTFDTCAISGKTDKGFDYLYLVTHTGDRNVDPVLEYKFENGTVYFDHGKADFLYSVMNDGRRIEYGEVQWERPSSGKILYMIKAIENDETPRCTVDTVLPHLELCTDILDKADIKKYKNTYTEDNFVRVKGLCDLFEKAYDDEKFPDELEKM